MAAKSLACILLLSSVEAYRLPCSPVSAVPQAGQERRGRTWRASETSNSRSRTPAPTTPPLLSTSATAAFTDPIAPVQPAAVAIREEAARTTSFAKVLWRFTRPHTFIGTALCVPALHLFAAPAGTPLLTMRMFYSILWALLPAGFINVYITGLNQVTDVEIDKINKPYLPIAAGQLSKATATGVVLLSLVAGLGLGFLPSIYSSSALLSVLLGSVLLGTIYSVPPFRLKRFPVLAALCIIAVRGSLINVGFYAHALTAAFGAPGLSTLTALANDMKCVAATAFFAVFGAVIAFMKDVPDVKGDAINDIKSFSVRAGARRMFDIGTFLTTTLFTAAGFGCFAAARHAFGVTGTLTWTVVSRAAVAIVSMVSASIVRAKAVEVNPEDGKQVYSFYMFLWKLFYLSYLALPFAR